MYCFARNSIFDLHWNLEGLPGTNFIRRFNGDPEALGSRINIEPDQAHSPISPFLLALSRAINRDQGINPCPPVRLDRDLQGILAFSQGEVTHIMDSTIGQD